MLGTVSLVFSGFSKYALLNLLTVSGDVAMLVEQMILTIHAHGYNNGEG
jgi:hypothetical protein